MKKHGMILLFAIAMARSAFPADEPACVPAQPKLRVAAYDTELSPLAPYFADRTSAMATVLPQTAQQQNLDVMCVTGLRDQTLRQTVAAGFSSATWNVYQPAPYSQSGCQSACRPNSSVFVQGCANSFLPGYDVPCIFLDDFPSFEACVNTACPLAALATPAGAPTGYADIAGFGNPECLNCIENDSDSDSYSDLISKCSNAAYDPVAANQCIYEDAGDAGTALISRYPFIATEYHRFTPPSTIQAGVVNWGVAYAEVQTPLGPVHLFCSDHATSESGMLPGAAQPQNASQDQDLLNYINSKAHGQPAIYLGNTGSGPAVASSPTGAANAQWLSNFSILQGGLTDALLANTGSNFLPSPAAACTYNCGSPASASAGYVDHIMTSGKGTDPTGYTAGLCENNGGTILTSATVNENGTAVPLSTHFGVLSEVHLQASPFSGFSVPLAAIDDGKHPGFALSATLKLSKGNAALQPASQAMTLQVGGYSVTLPAGSFSPLWKGSDAPWVYSGTVNGTQLVLSLAPTIDNSFLFSAAGSPFSLTKLANPVTITLVFGDDFGTASVNALLTTL